MSTTEATLKMERGSSGATLLLKTRTATLNMERKNAFAILSLQRLVGDVVQIFGYFDSDWFDQYFNLETVGTVGLSKKLKIQGDK